MVKDGSALAHATSIGQRAATGVFADVAGGIRRYASGGAAPTTIVYPLCGER
jgi:hypothetical protein